MAYYAPLSEKTINTRLEKAGLTSEKITFIRTFFKACVNLYGSIMLEDVWKVYKLWTEEFKPQIYVADRYVKVKREDLTNAARILQREKNDAFAVFDGTDIFFDINNADLHLILVHPSLVGTGYDKYADTFMLWNNRNDLSYYVGLNLLDFSDEANLNKEKEEALKNFVGDLVINLDIYQSRFTNNAVPCTGEKGKKIREFNWINPRETVQIEVALGKLDSKRKPNEKRAAELKAKFDKPLNEKLVVDLRRIYNLNLLSPDAIFDIIFGLMDEIGAGLEKDQAKELVRLAVEMRNSQHLWYGNGWSPEDAM